MATPQHIFQLDTKNWRIKSSDNVKNTATLKVLSIKITILNLNTVMMKMNEKFWDWYRRPYKITVLSGQERRTHCIKSRA